MMAKRPEYSRLSTLRKENVSSGARQPVNRGKKAGTSVAHSR